MDFTAIQPGQLDKFQHVIDALPLLPPEASTHPQAEHHVLFDVQKREQLKSGGAG
ncbi:hypothetical protein U27_01468 [Candidatus Vecturithrix granuli]|uniref:Uncharacterized protein n=1 Tax=Vecturithrix granuli TaxID=1499967 RepID=A0A081CAG2_VECG1|nr:hypothetical protein U27_01468 [Candidatus Vecturithrix granuli]